MSKTIVVTGAGGVLCSTLAKALAKEGNKVAVLDLRKEAADKVAEEINADGGQAIGLAANVLEKDSLEQAKKQVNAIFGKVDILVNGAGGNHPLGTTSNPFLEAADLANKTEGFKTFFDLDISGIQFTFNLNFIGTLLPTQVFAVDMIGRENCSVLNISSMNAFTPLTKIPAYSAAKAAVSNFTQWLAVHFSQVGIRVNALAPGFFLTDQNRSLLTEEDGSLTKRGQQIIDQTPMNRYGTPEDLVGTTLWLCGDGSKFVTGVVVPIDGGFAAYSGV
ncbi:D-mannonate oxidoreductase [Polaribacter vadi]|jgi:NAD(P)-dependent dehydrogenase (short-subunit alcohol dehydrogenase family)|uniref:D-mannonate oxidoreductase n=1 Tax=Polaribacter vadi TaxID=1774273 RepID=A0A1B8TR06_9FLAO|nr:SDR family oxidoreductase [Polaribacter vadi]AOW18522.1 D-mannonate oxidoreductase [Polaribacter vadi]OBY62117.1 D-mannonate oxidoreductase [Polaribacter vadi]